MQKMKILGCFLFCMLCTFAGSEIAYGQNNQTKKIIAAHYFGQHWPKNFISSFRREQVPVDLKRIKTDGFNTVIYLVSWGDFQPVIDPCCQWDERAFERLYFLLEEAKKADLQVILRVGYAWSFHPQTEPTAQKISRLLNENTARSAFLTFVQRLGDEINENASVVLSFMSWEDQWLRHISPIAQPDFDDYLSLMPANQWQSQTFGSTLPTANGIDAPLFNAYWDWLVMYRLFEPAHRLLPNLSYEIRIDKDPYYNFNSTGELELAGWLTHRAMYRQPVEVPVTIYWAPFWGAENIGEKLTAQRSAELLEKLLQETQEFSGQRNIFIDQFNVVDNTLGYERNAVIAPKELDYFLDKAPCILEQNRVIGYGYWTTRDYYESPLYNPSFSFGLEGWTLTPATDIQSTALLNALPSGDFELQLSAGDILEQTITTAFGRLPTHADSYPDNVCIEVASGSVGALSISVGAPEIPAQLQFTSTGKTKQCVAIFAVPTEDQLTLKITAELGANVRLRDVWFFDHVQFGGLYDADGNPGPLHKSLLRFNQAFASKNRCF